MCSFTGSGCSYEGECTFSDEAADDEPARRKLGLAGAAAGPFGVVEEEVDGEDERRSSDDSLDDRSDELDLGLLPTKPPSVCARAVLTSGEKGRSARSLPMATRRLPHVLASECVLVDECDRAGDGGTGSAMSSSLPRSCGDLDGAREGGSEAGGERMAPARAGERGTGSLGAADEAGRRKRIE